LRSICRRRLWSHPYITHPGSDLILRQLNSTWGKKRRKVPYTDKRMGCL
jgi:hypothetical protein